jgi:site-specific DNA-methyltransferase (adenine-specific)
LQSKQWIRESSRRGEDIEFSHYREIAKLTPEKQEEYLKKASDEKLSVRDLRDHVRRDKFNHVDENEIVLPANIKLLEGNVFEKINEVADKSIDLLITDPPYLVMNDYEWDKKDLQFLEDWVNAIKPKLKDEFIGYIFCDARMQYDFENILRRYFDIKNRVIWIRKNMANGRVIKDRFISSYEVIFYFGNKELNLPIDWGAERFDTMEYAVPQSNFKEGKFHPTQKPLELFKRLINLGSKEGELVLDCFAGSGTTGIACKELNRSCIMIEQEEEYNKIIKIRLND